MVDTVNQPGGSTHYSADPLMCDTQSKSFAAEICGEISRTGSELKLSQSEFTDLIDSSGGSGARFSEMEYAAYDNVYRKDLPLDRQNTRECKSRMASLRLNFCRHQQCINQCDIEDSFNQQKGKNYQKNVQRCLSGKSAECKVKCRMGGTSFTACEQHCSGGSKVQWQQACEGRYALDKPLVRGELQANKNRCIARCDNSYLPN